MEPTPPKTCQASAANTRLEPSKTRLSLEVPRRLGTAAGVLPFAVATKARQSSGPATSRGGRRFHAFRHPCTQHGFIHHARIDALQPMIPPRKDCLEESYLGAGKCKMRIAVCPWPDETLAGDLQSLKQTRYCILITVGPTADGVDRALDRRIVLACRSMLPIQIAALVLQ